LRQGIARQKAQHVPSLTGSDELIQKFGKHPFVALPRSVISGCGFIQGSEIGARDVFQIRNRHAQPTAGFERPEAFAQEMFGPGAFQVFQQVGVIDQIKAFVGKGNAEVESAFHDAGVTGDKVAMNPVGMECRAAP
jgi:hypothetical protein